MPRYNSNKAFTVDIDESGIDTYSQAASMSHYDGIYNNSNAPPSVTQAKTSFLNTSSISFDLLNTNANSVKTRYDVKSLSSSSLYGSRVNILLNDVV